MWRSGITIGALLAAAVAIAEEPRGTADARRVEHTLQAVIAKAEPAVACLFVYRPDPRSSGDRIRRRATPDDRLAAPDFYATGVVIDPQGFILTNYHVLREAAGDGRDLSQVRIRVRLPGGFEPSGAEAPPREASASIHAADARSDLAVLQIEQHRGGLPVIPIGRGEDLRKGSLVVALGHPYAAGFRDGSPAASTGIVSNLSRRPPGVVNEIDRSKLPINAFGTLIQTDVRLQLGTSGGALLDLDGKLVGLTTAHAALTGVDAPGGFAIPMDEPYRRIIGVLLRGEEVEYGFLGISTRQDVGRFLQAGEGVEIDRIIPNSPAENRLRSRDVILKVNGRTLREYDDLFLNLATALAGKPTALVIRRDGRDLTIDLRLVKSQVDVDSVTHRRRDDFGSATKKSREWHGLRIDYTSVIAKDSSIIPYGVLVREATGSAKDKGLVPYEDIITQVNGKSVNNPAEFFDIAEAAVKRGDSLKLTIAGSPPRTVTLP
jgi:serine protease Do